MLKTVSIRMALLSALLLLGLQVRSQQVTAMRGFPTDEPGYELGVSACYAGVIGDKVIIAGGCNFPETGKKRYYSGIYAARLGEADSLCWRLIGHLPEPAAYGGVVRMGDSLIFVGGNNAEHSLRSVYLLTLSEASASSSVSPIAIITPLPSLPCTADNISVTGADGCVYVFGGNQDGKASKDLWCLDVRGHQHWRQLPSAPGSPRVQPVLTAAFPVSLHLNNSFSSNVKHRTTPLKSQSLYVWGGFYTHGKDSQVATDGLCFNPQTQKWCPLPAPTDTLGRALTLSGGVALTVDDGQTIVATGGVNKDIFRDAISGDYRLVAQQDYLKQPISWYRFSGHLLFYHTGDGRWQPTTFADRRLARAGAQLVQVAPHTLLCIGGELKPSVRTPEIVKICF